MTTIGDGEWDSAIIQDRRWRKLIEQVADRARPDEERLRLAKKILRDGNDLACCVLFHLYRAEAPLRGWGRENPLDPALGAMRFRALRILGAPSRMQGRDHREAAQLLPWIAKGRDRTIFARLLQQPPPPEAALLEPTLDAIARLAPELAAEPDPDDLYGLLCDLSLRADLSHDLHRRAALALAAWPHPQRIDRLTQAAATDDHRGPSARWHYLLALHTLDPQHALPLLRLLRDQLGRGHLLLAEIDRTLSAQNAPP